MADDSISNEVKIKLKAQHELLNPLQLKKDIDRLTEKLLEIQPPYVKVVVASINGG